MIDWLLVLLPKRGLCFNYTAKIIARFYIIIASLLQCSNNISKAPILTPFNCLRCLFKRKHELEAAGRTITN